jgi:hypothetical protein
MGIPYYFYSLTKKYQGILHSNKPNNTDIYCIDFNGIIHNVAQQVIKTYNDKNENICSEDNNIKEIEEKILDKERHKTYGFDAAKFEQLTKNRPLEITKPMSIPYLKMERATSIFDIINRNSTIIVGDEFTGDDENWWESKEAANLKKTVAAVQQSKKERVDWCAYDRNGRECMGDAWM